MADALLSTARRGQVRRDDVCAETPEAGFTLVEVIVGLALAALIGVLLVNAVRVTGTAASAIARGAVAEDVQSVRDHLRRSLGSLARQRSDGTRPVLEGGPDGLQAVIGPDRSVERLTERVMRLTAAPRGDGTYDLVESRMSADTAPGEGTVREVVLARVAGLAIRYFGSQAERAAPAWHAAWASPSRRPGLIEIAVAFPPADGRRWSPLLVAPGGRP